MEDGDVAVGFPADIRSFRESDRKALKSLWADAELIRPWNDPDTDIDTCLGSGHGDILVMDRDGKIAGSVMVGHDGHRAWVYYLAVNLKARGQGYGKRLMAAAEAWARARDIRKLELMVRTSNKAAERFYRSIGYDQANVIVMQRWLDGTEA